MSQRISLPTAVAEAAAQSCQERIALLQRRCPLHLRFHLLNPPHPPHSLSLSNLQQQQRNDRVLSLP